MKGLFCIALCHLDDQTCAYKCLLKYESWLISKFSACAFEKQLLALVSAPQGSNCLLRGGYQVNS